MSPMCSLRDTCAIVGVGQTRFTRGETYRTPVDLSLEASAKAIADAGLKPHDIDGVVCSPLGGKTDDIITNFGLSDLKYHAISSMGGASNVAAMQSAIMAISAGLCSNVLLFFSWNGYSDMRVGGGKLPVSDSTFYHYRLQFEKPYGYWSPAIVMSAWVNRHMHLYGTKSRQLGEIAVACRKHACLNDDAVMRVPITIEDHQNSRAITNCLRLLDCSLETDGGGAVVITSAERAKSLKQRPVYIMGIGEGHPPLVAEQVPGRPDFLNMGAASAGKRAFEMAGVTLKDLDFAELYDGFSFVVLFQLEELGFCPRGDGGPYVEGGRIQLGGEMPVNTHGGLLSQAHVWGINHIVEGVKQLRGQAGKAQVKDAEIGLVTGFGAVGDCAAMILRR